MSRAAILIGVKKCAGLAELQATMLGVKSMAQWARGQGVMQSRIKVLTDDVRPVKAEHIKVAINDLLNAGPVEQLLLYFTGHGINKHLGELWLLSGAPGDAQAAVNVASSVEFARWCGIPHVVFISDACRTAPEGLQAQNVTGSDIFPNTTLGGTENPVDQFFACTLGTPALEIKDPKITAGAYRGIFTDALIDAIEGRRHEVIEISQEGGVRVGYVRPRPLKAYLQKEVASRLSNSAVAASVFQTPDARITSDSTAWISRFRPLKELKTEPPSSPLGYVPMPASGGPAPLAEVSESILLTALRGGGVQQGKLSEATELGVAGAHMLGAALRRAESPFGPTHFETGCGFKVSGKTVVTAVGMGVNANVLGVGDLVRISNAPFPAANVLLIFADGTGVVLPAIPEFLGSLLFEEGELVNVSYEPSDQTGRWQEFAARESEIRSLRALIAASSRLGVFRLEGEERSELGLVRRMQYAKGIDPSMAVYAAYGYQGLARRERIREMEGYMLDDIHLRLFDVALLARTPAQWQHKPPSDVFPDFPMLAQGWAMLSAYRVQLPPGLVGIEQHVSESLWTVFDPTGTRMIQRAMQLEVEVVH